MIQIEYVKNDDKEFWYKLDKHLTESEFVKKVRDKQGYVLFVDSKPVGILRYNLFGDNTPFCNMLFIDWNEQKKGYNQLVLRSIAMICTVMAIASHTVESTYI